MLDVLNKKKLNEKLNSKYLLWKQTLIFYAVFAFQVHLIFFSHESLDIFNENPA